MIKKSIIIIYTSKNERLVIPDNMYVINRAVHTNYSLVSSRY